MSEEKSKNKRNKGGRPKIDESNKLQSYSIRLSPNDLNKLKEDYKKLSGIKETFRQYLRAKVINGKVNVIYISKGDGEIVKELVKIGTNLNQIAKRINHKDTVSGEEYALNMIQIAIDNIYKTYFGEKDT